jgi:hypothetical protein
MQLASLFPDVTVAGPHSPWAASNATRGPFPSPTPIRANGKAVRGHVLLDAIEVDPKNSSSAALPSLEAVRDRGRSSWAGCQRASPPTIDP